jgi:hypothetical protein
MPPGLGLFPVSHRELFQPLITASMGAPARSTDVIGPHTGRKVCPDEEPRMTRLEMFLGATIGFCLFLLAAALISSWATTRHRVRHGRRTMGVVIDTKISKGTAVSCASSSGC